MGEGGIGFDGELVPGEVAGGEGDGLLQIFHRGGFILSRQAEHQVEVEVIEAGGMGVLAIGAGGLLYGKLGG